MMEKGISVIVCTYNGVDRLKPTLESIATQHIDNVAWELIVVDNASTDNTTAFCHEVMQAAPAVQFRTIQESAPGLNNARLCGLLAAQYDIILFCDDDNHLHENYLQEGNNLMRTHENIGALGGHGIPLFEGEKPDWFDKYAHSFAVGPQAANSGKIDQPDAEVYGAGSFYRRQPMLSFFSKGFSTIMSDRKGNSLASGGDVEWCYLIQLAGYDIWYSSALQFYHQMPSSRMHWDYYLRLKAGIASGSARLFPYKVLLHNWDCTLLQYRYHWIKQKVKVEMQWQKNKAAKLIRSSNESKSVTLAATILSNRATAFRRDKILAAKHFANLRKWLAAIN